MMFLMGLIVFAEDSVELQREVTGVDMQTIETVDNVSDVNGINDETLKDIDVNIKDNSLKSNKETLSVEQTTDNKDLDDELSKGMSDDKSWFKYILGGILLVAGIVAL